MVIEIKPLFWTSSTKCDTSTKKDALLDGISKKQLYLENHSMYEHRTFTIVLLRTCRFHWILHSSPS